MASYKYIPEFMRARSEASSRAWHSRWEADYFNGEKLSKKAEAYIEKTFGPLISDPGAGADYEEDFTDYWDFRDDETGDCG